MMVSLDGFFEGENHDLSWHNVDEEFNDFAISQLNMIDTLLFGRKTYELMTSYWGSESAKNDDPIIAGLMNIIPKIVFSKTLKKAKWMNTNLVKDDVVKEISELKEKPGKDIAIFGSNNLSVFLAENNLIDEFRIMVNPVILGSGTPLFTGAKEKLNLNLIKTTIFKSGNVLLYFKPLK